MNLSPMSRSSLSPIEANVRAHLEEHFSGSADPRFVVAVSGGIDSMCLLHVFHRLNVPALVAHMNYQKRGEASDLDEKLVKRIASEWNFKCHTEKVNPENAKGENFQQWARDRRYEMFYKLREREQADGIALAHHEDDQVETILQKLFRGAGLSSWSGMDVWDGTIFRPLLNVSRGDIERYARDNEIPYRTDESNLKTDFARNLLRNEWLDKLNEFFPGWKRNVLQLSERAEHYEDSLRWIADKITDNTGIDREEFHGLETGLQKALILFLLKRRRPDIGVSRHSLSRVEELPELQTGKEVALTPEFSILRDRDRYIIQGRESESLEPVRVQRDELESRQRQVGEALFAVERFEEPDFDRALYLDAGKLEWPITVRRWREGDRIQPLGMEGHQLVSDHLTNRKIRAAHKEKALVVQSFEETICAIIFPPIKNQSQPGTISEQVRCDSDTESCLKITYPT